MRTPMILSAALALAACGKDATPPAGGAPASTASAAPASAPEAWKNPPADAKVHFVWPQDESTVFAELPVVFGVDGMTVTPAGEAVEDSTRGHHHIIIDGQPLAAGTMVPMDEKNIHFGKGQTETKLKLTPGKHTLTLQFADGMHKSYGPKLASTITVNVVALPEPAPRVFFKSPADGAKVTSPVKLEFGVEGFTLSPAGENVTDKTKGHHHVIVDGKPIPAGVMVPADATHIHFGKAQTEAEIPLTPGKHTLTLALADGLHLAYGPDMTATITVEVEAGGADQAAPASAP